MQISNLRLWYNRLFALAFVLGLFGVLGNSLPAVPFGLDDGLWMRSKLISRYADLRLTLGDRVFPKVLVGEDGWLVFTGERSLDDFQNTFEMQPKNISAIRNGLLRLDTTLRERNSILLVVIVPNKSTVYPDSVPSEIEKLANNSRLQRLVTFIKKKGPPVLLDLRPILRAKAGEQQIYYKTDTHWNIYGAFTGYQAIIQTLQKDYPALQPRQMTEFTEVLGEPVQMDLVSNIGAGSLVEPSITLKPKFPTRMGVRQLPIGDRQVTMTWTSDQAAPTLLMYHDSFGFPLIPLMGLHFSQATFVPHYSGDAAWQLNWIDQLQPDIVVIEFTERYLHDLERLLGQ